MGFVCYEYCWVFLYVTPVGLHVVIILGIIIIGVGCGFLFIEAGFHF